MLSDRLQSIAEFIRIRLFIVEVPPTMRELAAVEAEITAAITEARALEGQTVPDVLRGDLPDGVVDLSDVRAHREFDGWLRRQLVPPYSPKGPGGAA